ncbi:MAG: hypothetical protein HYW01_11700 [Deltaproteobacteria bacterium]|nr:hypothetical protein [Deltaproteobacteria bacterium]
MKGKEKYLLILVEVLILLLITYSHIPAWIDKGYADIESCSSVKLETITPDTLRSLSFNERIKWYENRLSPCRLPLKESSARNNIPTILLSTIILNELADINLLDLGQEWIGVEKGSVGIAQIQIDTAMFHKLVDVREEEIDKYQNSTEATQRFGGKKPSRNQALRILIAQKLMHPEIAIEAAAREIKKILENIKACSPSPWINNFLTGKINLTNHNPNQIYKFIKGKTQREKNINLARMIAAPYNSSGIECVENPGNPFSPDDSGPFANPRKRSDAAALIASDLFDGNLFNN